jgi:hypothetical protein
VSYQGDGISRCDWPELLFRAKLRSFCVLSRAKPKKVVQWWKLEVKKLKVTFAGCHRERRKERRKEGALGGALMLIQVLRFMANLKCSHWARLAVAGYCRYGSSVAVAVARVVAGRPTDIAYQAPCSHAMSVVSRYVVNFDRVSGTWSGRSVLVARKPRERERER